MSFNMCQDHYFMAMTASPVPTEQEVGAETELQKTMSGASKQVITQH